MIDERTYEAVILAACAEIFDLVDDAHRRGDPETDLPASSLVLMVAAPTFDADTPILNGLVRSGRLEIVEDRKILASLADWDRLLRDYLPFAERARQTVDTHHLPAIIERGDVGAVLMLPTSLNRIDVSQYPNETVKIRVDAKLKGFVAERWRNGSYAVRRLDDARKAAQEVVEAIDASMSR